MNKCPRAFPECPRNHVERYDLRHEQSKYNNRLPLSFFFCPFYIVHGTPSIHSVPFFPSSEAVGCGELSGGISNACGSFCPLTIGARFRICSVANSGLCGALWTGIISQLDPLYSSSVTYMRALMIQSRSSSPSSGPLGPPRTRRKYFGRQSNPSSARLAASIRCRSSIFAFSSVATSWFFLMTACAVVYHSLCDSRSPCSSIGLVKGG